MDEIHDEIKKEVLSEKEKPESKYKKFLIPVLSVFMVFLILSFFFIRYPIFGIILGQMQSNPVSGNILYGNDFKIVFDGDTINEVLASWNKNLQHETALCLQGRKQNDTYTIDNVYQPEIYDQGTNFVKHSSCDSNTIILFHSHPYKRCIASNTDLFNLARVQLNRPDVAMLIMCEQNRFSFYD